MGAAISAIEGWILAGFGLPAAFRALWERVASLFRAAFDFFRDLVTSVRAYVSYERQTVWSNENEVNPSFNSKSIGTELRHSWNILKILRQAYSFRSLSFVISLNLSVAVHRSSILSWIQMTPGAQILTNCKLYRKWSQDRKRFPDCTGNDTNATFKFHNFENDIQCHGILCLKFVVKLQLGSSLMPYHRMTGRDVH